ncbi:hypothetical protein CBS101457_002868 [Exobasidium rhododendri]|nr:hypothetical protein CBS101457_002868 [Exobasidium rhododendri]
MSDAEPTPSASSPTPNEVAPTVTAKNGVSAAPVKGSPNDFLKTVIGKQVIVRLNSGVDYHGTLSCLDGFMNIALEETQEVVEGVQRGKYGDTFIRGNNVLYITAK